MGDIALRGQGKALMKKGGLLKIAKELKKSSTLHGKQSKIITKMVKEGKNNDQIMSKRKSSSKKKIRSLS